MNIKSIFGLIVTLFISVVSYSQNVVPENGSVGIGTTAPDEKLHVTGNIKTDSCLIANDSVVVKSGSRIEKDLKVEGKLYVPNLSDATISEEKKYTIISSDGEVKKVTRDGLIGDVYGKNCVPIQESLNGPVFPAPVWQSQPIVGSPIGYLFTGIDCPAYVGIGTDTPQYRLDVRGTSFFLESMGLGRQPDPSALLASKTLKPVGLCIEHNYTQPFGYAFKAILTNNLSKGIGIYNENYQKDIFTVYGNGKIEVSNDTEKILQLESDGKLRTREIFVDALSWPDYVFEKDYQLMPLNEVESFIDENGHLPEVPSAEEVEENGQNVGEMNKILLKKIEELTLHLIKQQRQIEELKQQLQK